MNPNFPVGSTIEVTPPTADNNSAVAAAETRELIETIAVLPSRESLALAVLFADEDTMTHAFTLGLSESDKDAQIRRELAATETTTDIDAEIAIGRWNS